jgi:hypothetical protein
MVGRIDGEDSGDRYSGGFSRTTFDACLSLEYLLAPAPVFRLLASVLLVDSAHPSSASILLNPISHRVSRLEKIILPLENKWLCKQETMCNRPNVIRRHQSHAIQDPKAGGTSGHAWLVVVVVVAADIGGLSNISHGVSSTHPRTRPSQQAQARNTPEIIDSRCFLRHAQSQHLA